MRFLSQIAFGLKSLFSKRKLDEQLSEEIRAHVEMATEANVAAGMTPDEARYAALREFGNVGNVQEETREERAGRWIGWFELAVKDCCFALRSLRRSSGFTLVAVGSLTLGIGANTAVFSLVNGILLRSLPVPNPQELRVIQWTGSHRTMSSMGNFEPLGGSTGAQAIYSREIAIISDSVSVSIAQQLQETAGDLAQMAGYAPVASVNARAGGLAFASQGLVVSGNFFSTLGVPMLTGRSLGPADDLAGALPAAVISYDCWQRQFGGVDQVLGQTLMLNEASFTVVGVTRPDFHGVHPGDRSEFFVPLTAAARLDPVYSGAVNGRDLWWVRLIVRLQPHGTTAALQTALGGVFARAAAGAMKEPKLIVAEGRAGPDWERRDYQRSLWLLLAVVGAVIGAACANLAGLCLARGEARRHEFAVRAALGSSPWRLLRVSLLENFVLAGAGAALGVWLAIAARPVLSNLAAGRDDGLRQDTSVDGRVLAFTVGLAFLTALLSGILPGWKAAQAAPLDALKRGAGARLGRLGSGRVLVSLQIGLATLLLAAAGLYGRTLLNYLRLDNGYPLENRLVFRVKARTNTPAGNTAFHDRIEQAMARLPAAQTAVTSFKPLLGGSSSVSFKLTATAVDAASERRALRHVVSASFFQTMGIPISAGRGFTATDGAARGWNVVVVNEAFAKTYFRGQEVVGQLLHPATGRGEWRIVGVCRDAQLVSVKNAVEPAIFFDFAQLPMQSAFHVVRSEMPVSALMQAVREAVASVDPELAPGGMAMLDEVREKNLRMENLLATLVGALSLLAVLLAGIGVYALMAFSVISRRREFGLKTALGARSIDIGWPVLREALVLCVVGLVAGGITALTCGRFIESQLYGVTAQDPKVLLAALGVMLGCSLLAAWLPAWRAAKIDPMIALRVE